MEKELDFFDQLDKADRERDLEERGCGSEKTLKSIENQIKSAEEQRKKLREQEGNNLNMMSLKKIQEDIASREAVKKDFLEKAVPKSGNNPDFLSDPERELLEEIKDGKEDPSEEYYGRYHC